MLTIKNVVVSGAKGNMGPIVVQALLDSGFTVSVLTRDSSTTNLPSSVKLIQTDYSESSLIKALKDQDAVVSTIGAIGTMIQTKVINAAVANGVKRFIPSDYAFNTPDMSELERTLPGLHMRLKDKATIIDYLVQKAAKHPSFSWTAIGSGPLFDWTLKTGFGGTSIATHTTTIVDSGNEPYMTTTRAQIGRAIASVLHHPQETANKYLFITSFTTTQNKVLEALESATGSTWHVNRVTSQERHQEGLDLLAKGSFLAYGNFWGVWCHTDGKGHVFGEEKLANGMLGLPREDMETVIKEVAASVGK